MPPAVQLLVIVVILGAFWLLLMRPARNQQRAVAALQRELVVGDEVVLSSGIFGTVRSLEEGRIALEVAPGMVLTIARQAVVRRVDPTDDGAPGVPPAVPPDAPGPVGDAEGNPGGDPGGDSGGEAASRPAQGEPGTGDDKSLGT